MKKAIQEIELDDPNKLVPKIMLAATRTLQTGNLWWRGHEKAEWKLRPGVYRTDIHPNRGRDFELGATYAFCRKAPARYSDWPQTDHERLFLMQHHGLPTRLLDWTESPLVALSFAVLGHDCEPAVVWGLAPRNLNKDQGGCDAIPHPTQIWPLFKHAFTNDIERNTRALAINPPHIDIRMVVQQSHFTIHGSGEPSLEQLSSAWDFLLKIIIPADVKKRLKKDILPVLGIRQSDLFPDLDHLAEDLKHEKYHPTISEFLK